MAMPFQQCGSLGSKTGSSFHAPIVALALMVLAWPAQAQQSSACAAVDREEQQGASDYFRGNHKALSLLDDTDKRRDGKYGWDVQRSPPRLMIPPTFVGITPRLPLAMPT